MTVNLQMIRHKLLPPDNVVNSKTVERIMFSQFTLIKLLALGSEYSLDNIFPQLQKGYPNKNAFDMRS